MDDKSNKDLSAQPKYVRACVDLYSEIQDLIKRVEPEVAISILCTCLAKFALERECPEESFQKMFDLVKKIMNRIKQIKERKNDN